MSRKEEVLVSDLNAQAIHSLMVGNHSHSIAKLQQALELVRLSLAGDPGKDESVSNRIHQERTSRMCIPVGTRACMTVYDATVDQEDSRHGDRAGSCVFRFFDRAFALATDACESRTSCVILYNLALSHSLAWLETRNAADLSMAIELYKMSLAAVESLVDVDASVIDTDNFILLLLMALFNNLGYLQHFQAQNRQATISTEQQTHLTHHCVGAIRALLATRYPAADNNEQDSSQGASAGGVTQQQHPTQHEEDFLFFRWSVLFLFQQTEMNIAPAA